MEFLENIFGFFYFEFCGRVELDSIGSLNWDSCHEISSLVGLKFHDISVILCDQSFFCGTNYIDTCCVFDDLCGNVKVPDPEFAESTARCCAFR